MRRTPRNLQEVLGHAAWMRLPKPCGTDSRILPRRSIMWVSLISCEQACWAKSSPGHASSSVLRWYRELAATFRQSFMLGRITGYGVAP